MFDVTRRDGLLREAGASPFHFVPVAVRDLHVLDSQFVQALGQQAGAVEFGHAETGRNFAACLIDHFLIVDEQGT